MEQKQRFKDVSELGCMGSSLIYQDQAARLLIRISWLWLGAPGHSHIGVKAVSAGIPGCLKHKGHAGLGVLAKVAGKGFQASDNACAAMPRQSGTIRSSVSGGHIKLTQTQAVGRGFKPQTPQASCTTFHRATPGVTQGETTSRLPAIPRPVIHSSDWSATRGDHGKILRYFNNIELSLCGSSTIESRQRWSESHLRAAVARNKRRAKIVTNR
ncbi:hypothetical protein EGW08_016124 [Elysia chlorotica]|uniref:Uncharacterized protein n=1 Tax=Elysia chlorotica TaxID=188477 RepID=A0A3S0ZV97_ELYCH|nr:hypothetical protein EGW08_016124 [Elysia chlorotica]